MTSTPAARRRNNKMPALTLGIVIVLGSRPCCSLPGARLFLTSTGPEPNQFDKQ
jgi:hypothetical protein